MYVIAKKYKFSASHTLTKLPVGHKCRRTHGHNYEVTVYLASQELDELGFVIDFGLLSPFKVFIEEYFDHRHLNDLPTVLDPEAVSGSDPLSYNWQPTVENIARLIYERFTQKFPELVAVKVSETDSSYAVYSPADSAVVLYN